VLLSLRIRDLAIIETLEIEFSPGLNILTGETGAGKSIIVGALELILGGRASADDIRSQSERARVEAVFDISALPHVRKWLGSHGLESGENDLIVAREISRSGRGRNFIMGSLVPLAALRELGNELVDLHGQHQHQSLLAEERHLDVLDDFARTGELRHRVANLFAKWRKLRDRLEELSRDERQIEQRKDMLVFQVREIEAAALQIGEDERLEEERRRLAHAEALAEAALRAEDILVEGEHCEPTLLALLARVEDAVEELARYDPTTAPLAEELREERFKLEDIAARLSEYRSGLEPDPQRLEVVEDRLDTIRRLKKKYGATIEEILALCDENKRELERLEHRDDEIEKTRAQLERAAEELGRACKALSEARREGAKKLERALVRVLDNLNMPRTRFEVAFDHEPAEQGQGVPIEGRFYRADSTGIDRVRFLISPNPGEQLKPLRKIASGGEISRIMLALKSLIAANDRIPTLVFDEIDVGIGGATADRVGEKMAELSKRRQIICITHLPQIAAKARTHFAVEKKVVSGRTVTCVRRLEPTERPAELARLLEGARVTELGRRHAAQMIERAEKRKTAAKSRRKR